MACANHRLPVTFPPPLPFHCVCCTFFPLKKDKPPFDSVILVVRNPFHALVSEWNRQLSTKYTPRANKTGLAHLESHGPESFGTNKNWTHFVSIQMKCWSSALDWLVGRPEGHEVLMVHYEDLLEDRVGEVTRMLEFLQFNVTGERGIRDSTVQQWNL